MSRWTTKPGYPDTQIRTFNDGKYAGIGARIYAEITAADGVLYWVLLIEDVKRRRGGYETRCLARGILVDIPTARPVLKGRICRIAMTHVRAQIDRAIANAIEAMNVAINEAAAASAAAADLDLADNAALKAWDAEHIRTTEAAEREADRLASLLALAA